MAFYSIINISEEIYKQDESVYKKILADYKRSIISEEIYLELSLSSYALKENLSHFKGLKNLAIGSVYKEKHLETLLKLDKMNFFSAKTLVFCPVLSDDFLNLIQDNKYKNFEFVIPVYNSEDLDRVYTGNYKKVKIFPFIVNDIASLIKSLSKPFPDLKEKKLSPNESGYLPYSLNELINFILESNENFLRINFKKLIGVNVNYIIESILHFDPSIEIFLCGFSGENITKIKEIQEEYKRLGKISIATNNHDYESIKKLF